MRSLTCVAALLVLRSTLAATAALHVAYIGDAPFWIRGWRTFVSKVAGMGGFRVGRGIQRLNVTASEYILSPQTASNAWSAVQAAVAADADIIIAGTNKLNQDFSRAGEVYQIPSIHCSGGNPLAWSAKQPHSFGMHVPFTFYSKAAIATGRIRGMRTLTIFSSGEAAFISPSTIAALEWARFNEYEVIGPTVQWCRSYANWTRTCRIVNGTAGERCVCGEQMQADLLGYDKLRVEDYPGIYELYTPTINTAEPAFQWTSVEVSPFVVRFFEAVIDDIRSQGADPDVVVSWLRTARNAFYASHLKNFNAKMWIGLPHQVGVSGWSSAATTLGNELVIGASHSMYLLGGMQWHKSLATSDPVFNSNAEYVAFYRQIYGEDPDYDQAACSSAGSVLYAALDKIDQDLNGTDVAQRRQVIRRAIADLNDATLYGLTRFNKAGQSNGHTGVTTQFLPEGSGGAMRAVLPTDVAEATLFTPMPTWESKLGCPPGHFNTGTRCSACSPGTFSPNRSLGLNVTVCEQCPRGIGTSDSTYGAAGCGECPPGRVQDGHLHGGICRGCAPGTFRNSSMPGSACDLCSSATSSDIVGADACFPCAEGAYQPDKGQISCICKPGWYRHPNATRTRPCVPCEAVLPSSTTRYSGSISREDCTCDRGWYVRDGACRTCAEDFPKDSVDCSGFGSPPILRQGWMTRNGEYVVYLCPRRGDSCPGGVPVGVERCSEGGSDIACAWCEGGYSYSPKAGRCIPCTWGAYMVWVFLVVGALVLIILLRPPTLEYTQETAQKAIKKSFVVVTLAQIVDMFQICSVYIGSSLPWSTDTESIFFAVGGIFTFSSLSPGCHITGDRHDHALKMVILMNLMPAFLIAFLALIALPSKLFPSIRKRYRIPDSVSATNMALGMLVSFFTSILTLALNVVFATYSHPKINEASLLTFPYLLNSSDETVGLWVVAAVALALWCAGTIALVTLLQAYLQTTRPSLFLRHHCVVLVARHRDGTNWWLVFEMLQKFLVTVSVAIFRRADVQMQWMTLVFLFYLIALVHIKPYRFVRHNVSDATFTTIKIIILVLSVTSIHNQQAASAGIFPVLVFTFIFSSFLFCWCIFSITQGGSPLDDERHFSRLLDCMCCGASSAMRNASTRLSKVFHNSSFSSDGRSTRSRSVWEGMVAVMSMGRNRSGSRTWEQQPPAKSFSMLSEDARKLSTTSKSEDWDTSASKVSQAEVGVQTDECQEEISDALSYTSW